MWDHAMQVILITVMGLLQFSFPYWNGKTSFFFFSMFAVRWRNFSLITKDECEEKPQLKISGYIFWYLHLYK